jgi:hypothetical protein
VAVPDLDRVGSLVAEALLQLPAVQVDVAFAGLLAIDLADLPRPVDPLPSVAAKQGVGLGDMSVMQPLGIQREVAHQAG